MEHSFEIRAMTTQDAAAVAGIEQELFSLPWSEKAFLDSLALKDTLYLVCCCEGTIVGYCGLLQSFDEADITNVAVAPQWQGQHAAAAMLQELMKQGKTRGIASFTLEVRVSNAAAIHLYEKLGFHSVGIRRRFYEKPVEDAMIMWTEREE